MFIPSEAKFFTTCRVEGCEEIDYIKAWNSLNRAWVYILLCSDNTYYIGSTTDLEQRVADHNSGRYGGYTSTRLPIQLIWTLEFDDIRFAFEFERRIKKWSRAKKEALMKSDYKMLHELARSSETKRKLNNLKID